MTGEPNSRSCAEAGVNEGPIRPDDVSASGDKGYADRRAEDRWSVVRCESQRADPRPQSGAFDADLEFDAVTAAPGGEAVVSKCPDDIAPVPSCDSLAEVEADFRFPGRALWQRNGREQARLLAHSMNSSDTVDLPVAELACSTSSPTGSPTLANRRVETPASIRSITARVSGSRSAKYP